MKNNGKLTLALLALSALGCEEDRVALARKEKLDSVLQSFQRIGVNTGEPFMLFFRAFKLEKTLELWAKNQADSSFILLNSYPICAVSGSLGPKRQEGDKQVPEGVYHINRFNPKSKFYLSLGLNYPNEADRLLSDPVRPGGDIFIHGGCVSIGCLAMTDDQIKEIYILAEMAKENGQGQIEMHIFPTKMNDEAVAKLIGAQPEFAIFWRELEPIYQFFEETQMLPNVRVDSLGAYQLE